MTASMTELLRDLAKSAPKDERDIAILGHLVSLSARVSRLEEIILKEHEQVLAEPIVPPAAVAVAAAVANETEAETDVSSAVGAMAALASGTNPSVEPATPAKPAPRRRRKRRFFSDAEAEAIREECLQIITERMADKDKKETMRQAREFALRLMVDRHGISRHTAYCVLDMKEAYAPECAPEAAN